MKDQAEFKRIEFEIEARCIHCGALLYSEMAADERDDNGGLVEVERHINGDSRTVLQCKCRS